MAGLEEGANIAFTPITTLQIGTIYDNPSRREVCLMNSIAGRILLQHDGLVCQSTCICISSTMYEHKDHSAYMCYFLCILLYKQAHIASETSKLQASTKANAGMVTHVSKAKAAEFSEERKKEKKRKRKEKQHR